MTDFILDVIVSAFVAFPVTIALGLAYLSVALALVKVFGLQYGDRPRGFLILNWAVALTFVSYFFVFAFWLSRLR